VTEQRTSGQDRPHPHLRVDREGPVLTISLSNPERRNAKTPSLWLALAELAETLDPEVRVVVLRADGPSFSAGLDRAMLTPEGAPGEPTFVALAGLDPAVLDGAIATFQEAFTWWRDERIVSIAAVQGHAVGAGFQLALACDLRVLADDARLSMREPSLGLVPDLGGTQPLVELVGYPRALEICATARNVGAEEAVRIGFALDAVPADRLDGRLAELVTALTAPMVGAVRETKALVLGAAHHDLDTQRRLEREAQARRFRELSALIAT
jgi:enoyl-CoA hydratase/carnithine racemase